MMQKVLVSERDVLSIIDQMRIAIPEEVKKAQQLLSQRDRVMAQSQEEANRTIELAREKADDMVDKDGVTREAERRADQILSQVDADAEATRREADDYVSDTLNRLQDELERTINQVRNGIRTVDEDRMRRTTAKKSKVTSVPLGRQNDKK